MQLQRRTCSCTDAQGAPHGASKTPTQAWNLEPAVLAFEKFFDLVEGHRRFDAYTNSRFDAYINSLQTIDEMIPGDEMTDDPRFLLFLLFFILFLLF